MAEMKTQPTTRSVEAYLETVDPPRRREDAQILDALFRRVTGWSPVIWGESLIGYGRYHYRYESGREGTFLATGFAPRKAKMVLYVMPGYTDFDAIMARIGPHKRGKACLYLGALSKVDLGAVEELIRAGLDDLEMRWPVEGS